MHPAPVTGVDPGSVARHAPPRRAGTRRGDGCIRGRGVRGNVVDLARRARTILARSRTAAAEAEDRRTARSHVGANPRWDDRVKRPDAAACGAVVLLLVYALTLAPNVTFWDAGEFIAAAHSLGIPHPPGTPLYILLLSAWTKL